MKAENRFYVYAHIKPLTGEVFYIGRGTGKRIYSDYGRSVYWKGIVNKYGIEYRILKDGLTNDEANKAEKELIELYGRKEKGGTLCNLTDGGEGLCGYKPTIETLVKKSKAIKGRIIKPVDADLVKDQFLSGLTINEIAVQQNIVKSTLRKHIPKGIRQSENKQRLKKNKFLIKFEKGDEPWNKGVSVFVGADNPFYGKTHDSSTKQVMAAKKEKQLICLNNNQTYKSTIEAADKLGLFQASVAKVARGYQKQTQGFEFKYL